MGRSVHTLNVGGHARGLVLHAAAPPATPSSTGRSLLLLLHGSTEDRNNGSVHYPAERFERNYHSVFAEHGFTLVYRAPRYDDAAVATDAPPPAAEAAANEPEGALPPPAATRDDDAPCSS